LPGLAAIRNLAILPGLPKAAELTRLLLDEGIIPTKATDDAMHLGLAAAHGMDYLLTWNCGISAIRCCGGALNGLVRHADWNVRCFVHRRK